MEILFVYNTNFELVGAIDTYKSLIWTERYFTYGDFELQIPLPSNKLSILKNDYYIMRKGIKEAMIIENIEIKSNATQEDVIVVKGRSLLSLMDRRVIWKLINRKDIKPSVAITTIIAQNFMPTEDETYNYKARFCPELKISNTYSTQDTDTIKLSTSWGDIVLNKIVEIAKQWDLGIKIQLELNAEKPFNFVTYKGNGTDCVFSEHLGNLLSSDYTRNKTDYKNTCIVAGQGETQGINRWSQDIYRGSTEPTGFNRRECYLDCSSVNSTEIDGVYRDYLEARGKRELVNHRLKVAFSCVASPDSIYTYRKDYILGDRVKVMNKYGVAVTMRISEVIESWNENGHTVVPTFLNNTEV